MNLSKVLNSIFGFFVIISRRVSSKSGILRTLKFCNCTYFIAVSLSLSITFLSYFSDELMKNSVLSSMSYPDCENITEELCHELTLSAIQSSKSKELIDYASYSPNQYFSFIIDKEYKEESQKRFYSYIRYTINQNDKSTDESKSKTLNAINNVEFEAMIGMNKVIEMQWLMMTPFLHILFLILLLFGYLTRKTQISID